jgi:hypothetical protein
LEVGSGARLEGGESEEKARASVSSAWMSSARADVIGDAVDAPEGIDHQGPAEASPLLGDVDLRGG